jgi:hypothetical protein
MSDWMCLRFSYVEALLNLTRVATVSIPIVAETWRAEELGFRDFSSLFLVKENRRQLGNSACCISFIAVSSSIASFWI